MTDRSDSPMDTIDDWDDLTSRKLLDLGFQPVPRVSISDSELNECIATYPGNGVPLVIQDVHKHPGFDKKLLNVDWYLENGQQELEVRDVDARTDRKISTADFIQYCRVHGKSNTGVGTLYAKDAQCPDEWYKWATESGVIPQNLVPSGTDDVFRDMPPAVVSTIWQ